MVHCDKGQTRNDYYYSLSDLTEELQNYKTATIYNLRDFYTEDFFETKKLVHLPLKFKK